MHKLYQLVTVSIAVLCVSVPANPAKRSKIKPGPAEITGKGPAVVWEYPKDIATRNLFYGPGGKAHVPRGTFTFAKEDLEGSNPKFEVTDQDGVKWKVKMGEEARPETVASRLVWAVGYSANEDYFLPVLRVREMARLQRGHKLVTPDGIVYDVRLKRHLKGEKKIGTWEWAHNPFSGTRELNGLRIMMAVINNWDLKDENNAVYQLDGDRPEQLYLVSDLGASFATTGFGWTRRGSKGKLKAYEHSKFFRQVTPDYVSFYVPSRPALDHYPAIHELQMRRRLYWIGRRIPRTDARWMGEMLGRLSGQQIRDAFRAAAYPAQDVEGFSRVVEHRIAELRSL
jgi:hypothetical protein